MNAPFNFPMISVSPDGKSLAALEFPRGNKANKEKILKVISTEDGKARELCRFVNGSGNIVQPRWSADGRCIFFPGIRKGEEEAGEHLVCSYRGVPSQANLGSALHQIDYISPPSDGSRIVFFLDGPHGPRPRKSGSWRISCRSRRDRKGGIVDFLGIADPGVVPSDALTGIAYGINQDRWPLAP
ncbi:MAG: hypothetical protein MZV63_14245 [Marinilabiliales bacterium]|nr:hypothetical protein [Marinilabiliales bacterium]